MRRDMTSAELEPEQHGTLQRGQSGLRASKSFMAKALARGEQLLRGSRAHRSRGLGLDGLVALELGCLALLQHLYQVSHQVLYGHTYVQAARLHIWR